MIKNLTPHPINIIGPEGNVIATIAPEPTPARLTARTVSDEPIDGIATSTTVFGQPEGLPQQTSVCCKCDDWFDIASSIAPCHCGGGIVKVWLVVSQIIKSALPGRQDLLVPAEVVRDKSGAIIGCRSLGR